MRFEALNSVFKGIAAAGNFKATLSRCAHFWMVWTAHLLDCGSKSWIVPETLSVADVMETSIEMLATSSAGIGARNAIVSQMLVLSGLGSLEMCSVQLIHKLSHHGKHLVRREWFLCASWDDAMRCPGTVQEMACIGGNYFIALHMHQPLQVHAATGLHFIPSEGRDQFQLRVFNLSELVSLAPMHGSVDDDGDMLFIISPF